MINDLAEIIAIDTVCAEAKPKAPFGLGSRKALEWFLTKAKSYGLNCGEDEGYAAWAETGEGEKLIGILGHLDVVPPGAGWSTNPFQLEIDGGNLYGRGVSDDKGPVVACLHVLKRIKESGIKLSGRVRLIVGFNEENGSSCIKHYVKSNEVPIASFTPDADFPVVASEKGILQLKISVPIKGLSEFISDFRSGTRPNIVPNYAEMRVPSSSSLFSFIQSLESPEMLFRTEKVALTLAESGYTPAEFSIISSTGEYIISSRGLAAHASCPEKGDNAAAKLLSLISSLLPCEESAYCALLSSVRARTKFGLDLEDESGALTMNVGMVEMKNDKLILTVDIRRPYSSNCKNIINALSRKNVTVDIFSNHNPLFKSDDDKLVSTLLSVYRKVTGDYASLPLRIGGGTYAKELPNCVAFGATFPGVDTKMHEPDEFYPVEHFYKLCEIYYEAVLALDKAYLS